MGTGIKYDVFAANEKEVFVSTLRAARNIAFQGTITPQGHIEKSMVQRRNRNSCSFRDQSPGLRFADEQRAALQR